LQRSQNKAKVDQAEASVPYNIINSVLFTCGGFRMELDFSFAVYFKMLNVSTAQRFLLSSRRSPKLIKKKNIYHTCNRSSQFRSTKFKVFIDGDLEDVYD